MTCRFSSNNIKPNAITIYTKIGSISTAKVSITTKKRNAFSPIPKSNFLKQIDTILVYEFRWRKKIQIFVGKLDFGKWTTKTKLVSDNMSQLIWHFALTDGIIRYICNWIFFLLLLIERNKEQKVLLRFLLAANRHVLCHLCVFMFPWGIKNNHQNEAHHLDWHSLYDKEYSWIQKYWNLQGYFDYIDY